MLIPKIEWLLQTLDFKFFFKVLQVDPKSLRHFCFLQNPMFPLHHKVYSVTH